MRWMTFALLAAPGVLLGAVGATHPSGLNPDSAQHWFLMHLAGVLVFPLVGVALAWLVRGRRDLLAVGVMLSAYVYATFYTALDIISGIGNGYVTDQLGTDAVPRPAAISLAFRIGTRLGDIGAWALLLAAVLLTVDVIRRHGVGAATVPPAVLLLLGSWFLRDEHIFWPWGVLSCVAIGIGTGWLGRSAAQRETGRATVPAPGAVKSRPMVDGVHLRASQEQRDQISRLCERVDPAVGLAGVLDDLNRSATPASVPGRAPVSGFSWNDQDSSSPRWWPQGISSTADADPTGQVEGHRMLVTSWYCKDDGGGRQGSRVTFVDLETLRYRHVLIVRAVIDDSGESRLEPLHIHAGGVVWAGDHLYLAATRRGIFTCRVADIIRLQPQDDLFSFDHRYVLPVRFAYRAQTPERSEPLRYSFLSLSRSSNPPELVAGEYARGEMSTRIVRYPLDPDSLLLHTDDDRLARPVRLDEGGVGHMQGAVVVDERYYVTTSRGRTHRGHLYAGAPGALEAHRWALPPGPEDITYWPSTDQLWSLSEHPGRRFVFAMDRARFD